MGYINLPGAGDPAWKTPVDTASDLPIDNNLPGDVRTAKDTGTIYVWDGSSWVSAGGGGGGGSGTVTSVAMSVPSALLSVSGSPITSAGTLNVTLPVRTANTVFAAPDGSNGTPTFRAITANDIPTLNQNTTGTAANITATSNNTLTTLSSLSLPGSQVSGNISGNAGNISGTVAIANGGTGQTTAANAINALLPSQTGNNGKVLSTDGSVASWQPSSLLTLSSNPMLSPGQAASVGTVAVSTQTGGQKLFSKIGSNDTDWSYDILSAIATTNAYFNDMEVTPLSNGFSQASASGSLNFTTYPWTGDSTSIGVVSINTTAANGYYFLSQVNNNTFGSNNLVNKQITFLGRASLSIIPDSSTANTINMIGYGNGTGTTTIEHGNGFYFYASNASPNWFCKTAKGGVRTSTDSGVAITTNMTRFKIVAISTSVLFYIDDVLVVTHTTNIPNQVTEIISLTVSIQSQSTNYSGTRSIYVDYLGNQTTLIGATR